MFLISQCAKNMVEAKVGWEEDWGEVKEVVEVAGEPEEPQDQRRLLRRTFSCWTSYSGV